MGLGSVLLMSAMPVFRLLVHCGIGAYLSSPQANVMPADARKHINKLVFVCFMPSLVFSNLAQTVTVEKMLDWWFMPINVFLCYLIGAGIGICIYDHFKPPAHLKRLVIACCATGNSSNLPLVLLSAICVEAGSPFGRYDICTANGVAYISYGLWMATVLTWTVVFNYLKPEPVPQVEHHDQEDEGNQSYQDPQGFQQPARIQAAQGFQGSQGFINSQGYSPHGSQIFQGPQAFQAGLGPRAPFQNPGFHGPQGFQPGGYNSRGSGFQGFPPEFQLEQRNSFQDYNDGFGGPQSYQGFQVPPVRGPTFQNPQGYQSGYQVPQLTMYPDGFQTPPMPQAAQVYPPSQPLQALPPSQPAIPQAGAVQAPHGQPQPLTDDFSWANIQLWAEKYKIKECFTPPTTAAALAIPIGAIPFFRHLLYGHEAPFRFLGDALVILGEAMIPCMNLLLGGGLSQGFGASELATEVVICIMLTRLLLLPIAGLIVVKLAFSMGLVPADPLFHFVLLLQFTMPTAINVGTMTQLFGVGQTECSVILFWCYTSSVVFLTLWTMIFLILLI